MAWSNTQKALVARACADAGIADEHRRLIVAQVPGQRAIHHGRASTTSPRLTQEDFEFVMATIESYSGGQVAILHKGRRRYEPGHWQTQLEQGPLKRMRWLAKRIDQALQRDVATWANGGQGLRGWIRERLQVDHGDVDRLDFKQLTDLIHGLRAYARRNGARLAA